MKCPKCVTAELVARQVKDKDVVVYACTQCAGMWFLRGQMEKVLLHAIKDLAVPEDAQASKRLCPVCAKGMRFFYYPQTYVEIDMCPRCQGVWIDAGEAKEITIVRRSLKDGECEYDSLPGAKGKVIDFVNTALDWVLHSY